MSVTKDFPISTRKMAENGYGLFFKRSEYDGECNELAVLVCNTVRPYGQLCWFDEKIIYIFLHYPLNADNGHFF